MKYKTYELIKNVGIFFILFLLFVFLYCSLVLEKDNYSKNKKIVPCYDVYRNQINGIDCVGSNNNPYIISSIISLIIFIYFFIIILPMVYHFW